MESSWAFPPEVTDIDASNAAYANGLPAVKWSQILKWVQISVAAKLVHEATGVPVAAIDPPEAAANVKALRVVSVAALAVQSSPGAPVCIFTYTVVGDVSVVLRNTWSRTAFSR